MSATLDKRPDAMGVWAEEGDTVWLPREHYPKRSSAIAWAVAGWGVAWPEVRCLSRHMRYTPEVHLYPDGSGWSDDLWSECDRNEPGAFPVWRLESA